MRRLARTRRVGHGGTLDPMATGVLVIGVEPGDPAAHLRDRRRQELPAHDPARAVAPSPTTPRARSIAHASAAGGHRRGGPRRRWPRMTGEIDQVPSAVSAIKVDGQRAYKRVREGEEVELRRPPGHGLPARRARRSAATGDVVDVDVDVTCSSGTYIRAHRPRPGRRAGGRRPPDRAAPHRRRRLHPRRGGDPGRARRERAPTW